MPQTTALFYETAMQAGMRPIHLLPASDKCPAGTWENHVLSLPDEAPLLLGSGENVGFLLTGKGGIHPNPLGIWALMIHSQGALEHFGDEPFVLMLAWGDPHKRILLGRLPDPSSPRRNRVVKNSHEVRLGGILPTLGSIHPDGGRIEVSVRDPETRRWMPWDGSAFEWASIPIVDPTPYTPSTSFLILLDEQRADDACLRVPPEWVFWDAAVPRSWNDKGYSSAKGTLTSRKIRGDGFIRNRIKHGIVSRSGEEGRKTLLSIAVHLVNYLLLPDEMILSLLAEPVHGVQTAWNAHCVDARTQAPSPWGVEDLKAAVAASHEYLPPFGVAEYQRFRNLREGMERLKAFGKVLSSLPAPTADAPSMKAESLYETFLEMYNVEKADLTYRRFTLAIQGGIATGYLKLKNIRRTKKKLRYYQGISPEIIDFALELPAEESSQAA